MFPAIKGIRAIMYLEKKRDTQRSKNSGRQASQQAGEGRERIPCFVQQMWGGRNMGCGAGPPLQYQAQLLLLHILAWRKPANELILGQWQWAFTWSGF